MNILRIFVVFTVLSLAIVFYLQTVNANDISPVARRLEAGMRTTYAVLLNKEVIGWGGLSHVPSALSNVASITSNGGCVFALHGNGTVTMWREKFGCRLIFPTNLTDVHDIASNDSTLLVLKSKGLYRLVGWGDAADGGTLQIPEQIKRYTINRPPTAAAAGRRHVLVLIGGRVFGWGNNDYKQLNVPNSLERVVAIAAGNNHSLALGSRGLLCWGKSNNCPKKSYSNGSAIRAISTKFDHSLVLLANGRVEAFGGDNHYGELDVPPDLKDVIAVSAGNGYSVALQSDGTIVGWGMNREYQYPMKGYNINSGATNTLTPTLSKTHTPSRTRTPSRTLTPTAISLAAMPNLAAGSNFTLSILSNKTLAGWGTGASDIPIGLTSVKAVSSFQHTKIALKTDGTVVVWGDNSGHQLALPYGVSGVTAVSMGGTHALALEKGKVIGWGYNLCCLYGQQTPPPDTLSSVKSIAAGYSHSLALKTDGTVISWGYPAALPPARINNINAIAANINYSLLLSSNGTVKVYGMPHYELATVPTSLNGVIAIAAGEMHALALRKDGTVVAWGNNSYGQSSVPINLNRVVAIAAGMHFSVALKDDGTLIGWGRNDSGQLPPSGTNARFTPTRIPTGTPASP
jgi:alpha-tubulin suppressor-like RCC1 family protein